MAPLAEGVPAGFSNAVLALRFESVRPVGVGTGDVVVLVEWANGQAATGRCVAAADYNETSANRVHVDSMDFDGRSAKGSLRVTIGPDGAQRGRPKFPTPPDEFNLRFQAEVRPGEAAPYVPDREAFMPPWRKDTPVYGGERIHGAYEGEWSWKAATNRVSGRVSGAINHPPAPGRWGVRGNGMIRRAPGGGLTLTACLPTVPVADGGGAWAVYRFTEPRDWRGVGSMQITLDSAVRRDDVMLAMAVRDASGATYRVNDAAAIRAGTTMAAILPGDFAGLFAVPDWSRIEQIEIGLQNRDGAGTVEVTVRSLQMSSEPPRSGRLAGASLTVTPECSVTMNGTDTIPKGLFGFHDVTPGAAKQAATNQPDPLVYLGELRPGFLRSVEHTGFGGKPLPDEEVAARLRNRPLSGATNPPPARLVAADAVDGAMVCHTMDLWARPPWLDQGIEGLSNSVRVFYRNLAPSAWVPGDDANPRRLFDVWNEPFMWGRQINMGFRLPPGCRDVRDETQYGYLPGKVGAEAWADLFAAACEGAKAVNPHVKLGGPSSSGFCDDDYRMFTNYVARILDRVGDRMDFLTEHHYGGDPRTTAAGYEVATAWCDVRHGRRIPIYNTEANDLGGSDAVKAAYNVLDILTCAAWCPDKARGRALHALWSGFLRSAGEEQAYRFLSTLRGTRVLTSTSDPDVVCVASCPAPGQLVVVAMNAGSEDREVRMAPINLGIREGTVLLVKRAANELQMRDVDGAVLPVPEAGSAVLREIAVRLTPPGSPMTATLAPGCAVRWTFVSQNYRPSRTVLVDQHFATALVARVPADGLVEAAVRFRGATTGVKRAWLRYVAGGLQAGEGVVSVGGHDIPLPPDRRRDGQALIQEIPVETSWVEPGVKLVFRCAKPELANGYTVYAASLLTER
jgi:hypothetical protein